MTHSDSGQYTAQDLDKALNEAHAALTRLIVVFNEAKTDDADRLPYYDPDDGGLSFERMRTLGEAQETMSDMAIEFGISGAW